MGEEGEFYSRNLTMVFWNMDDYPIPAAAAAGGDLGFIRTNIEEALHRMGFHGHKRIDVYCKQIEPDVEEELGEKARICYIPSCTRPYMIAAVNKVAPPPILDMTAFMVRSAVSVFGPYGPFDVVVIAKPIGELDRVLKCLHSRGHAIVIIDPTAITGSFFSVESLLGCARLLTPPPPRNRTDMIASLLHDDFSLDEYLAAEKLVDEELSSYDVEDTSKIVDFLEPIRPVNENRTGVFWDAEDFPFPPFSTPDEVYAIIESVLLESGFIKKLSIWVYLDDNKKGTWRDALLSGGGKKNWASRIYFLPGGDNASRRIRMANDITFWAMDSSRDNTLRADLILLSDQFRDDEEYSELFVNLLGSCHILSVDLKLTQGINKPESDPRWPALLIDAGEWFGR